MVKGCGTKWADGRYEQCFEGPGITDGKINKCNVFKQMDFANPPVRLGLAICQYCPSAGTLSS